MSDENGKPRILTLESPTTDLEQAVASDETIQMGARALRRPVSRGEAVQFITTAALEMGQKIYDQVAAEHAEKFAQQEAVLRGIIAREFEARTLRGRWRAFLARFRPSVPTLTEEPPCPD